VWAAAGIVWAGASAGPPAPGSASDRIFLRQRGFEPREGGQAPFRSRFNARGGTFQPRGCNRPPARRPPQTSLRGSVRKRWPVSAKTAFATAGAIGGTPGSPSPPIGTSEERNSTFTRGALDIWIMR
jgi:hypothetical protein